MTEPVHPDSTSVKQCCANVYGSDAAKYLLGDSFHPGGLQLTEELASLISLGPKTLVLDVASGKGTTALFLAERFGCRVVGIDLSEQNIVDARALVETKGISDLVEFRLADAEALPFDADSFDAIVCECAFCTFPSKQKAASEFERVLRPGGRVGISDITKDGTALPELDGLLGWIACIGDAQTLQIYAGWLAAAGLQITESEYRSHCLQEMVQAIRGKLLMAEIMIGLKKLVLPGLDLSTATFKLSSRWTLIAGLRATWNTDPVNQHNLFARPAGSFLDVSHALAQPLSQAIQTNVRTLFPATPLFSWQPRASVAYKLSNTTALHAGGGVFNDIIPAQVADLGATNPPYAPVFVGGINGQVGGIGIAPGVTSSAVDATVKANQSFQSAFRSNSPTPLAVDLNTFPTGRLKTPYFLEWSLGLERTLGPRGSLRVDYVGTRSVQEPYQVQLNGYQIVCPGCFGPFAFNQPLDARFASVNELRTGAGSHYAGLQTAASKQFAGLMVRANYTFSHCIDEVSNGGLLPFSSLGILALLPGSPRPEYGNCDYDVRHNFSGFAVYEVPFRSSHALLQGALGGWQVSGTPILHSGVPFSVLSAPYTAINNGIFQGSGPQFANRVPGVPLYRKTAVAGVTQPGSLQWLNPDAFASVVDPSTGACAGGNSPANCQFGDSGATPFAGRISPTPSFI
jgi:ubiquinone/menaquinone biosynthesis C-methylase UbiE